MDTVKISSLELENVKRIKAVQLIPAPSGLTVIGGDNGQGKTSVLDAIAWALGGDRFRPSAPQREGSLVPPRIHLELSNGLVVERAGKNSALKVIDPAGQRGGQQLLNMFVDELALNLPKFMASSNRDKAETLLRIIGVGDRLHALESQERQLYSQRHTIGQVADQKRKYAKEMPFYTGVPKEPVSAFDLIQRQQDILAVNGENQRKRRMVAQLQADFVRQQEWVDKLEEDLKQALEDLARIREDLDIAHKDAMDLQDMSTAQIEEDLRNIDALNIKIRANCDREKAEQEAEHYTAQYDELTDKLEAVRQEKRDLLAGAKLPLEGLSVEDGELTYQGKKWDGMSGADQLRVSTAIVRALNPRCGFVLVDKLEQMDMKTLTDFAAWLQQEGLQVIATRVSKGSECAVIIEDGALQPEELPGTSKAWEAGKF